MHLVFFERQENSLLLHTDQGRLKLQVCADAIIRVIYTLEEAFSTAGSLMILSRESVSTTWDVVETPDTLTLRTRALQLVIDRRTLAFTWLDAAGRLLTREPAQGGKILNPVDVVKTRFDEQAVVATEQNVDGARARAAGTVYVDRRAYQTRLAFEWAEGEALYGLGQHEEGVMNRRGTHQYLYQQNMKVVIPLLLSTRGYGVLVDSYSLMVFHDDLFGSYLWTDIDDELDYYFIYGPEFDQIIAYYRQLTGDAPLLPRWAFGYLQSKERYTCQQELLDIVREYRARHIPLDGIVLDWRSWPEGLWGQKSFDPTRFPDPGRMTTDLHALGAHMMISIWPIMQGDSANRREMREQGCLLGNQATYDAFSPEGRALYWKQANEGLFSHGIDAWWCDCTEPFEADWNGSVKREPWERMLINTGEAKKYLDPEYISAYSLLHSQGIYEGQRQVTGEKRVVNLTRSGYAGQQRYGTITWSGDVTATWDTLRRQIPEGLNFCASGLPYWTLDIGAFFVGRKALWFWAGDYPQGCEDEGYRELYVRWFQYGAFLPMFRSHGTDTPREVWRFGEPGSRTYDTLVRFDRLRYRLLPYIYSLAARVTRERYTMLRALPFDFRHDPQTYDIADQFLLGPALLVNPVTRPMYFAANSQPLRSVTETRPVYLPSGCDWIDFWTGERLAGGQTIEAAAPLEILPLYVRSGSILPLGPALEHTGQQPDAPIELRIYPGADAEFTLYEDEGDSYRYEQGACALTRITWDDAEQTLSFAAREGAFAGMARERVFRVVCVRPRQLIAAATGTGIDATPAPDATVVYTGEPLTRRLPTRA